MTTPTKEQEMKALFETIGIKGEFNRTARRYLRSTPEYAAARSERRARAWLDGEANSMADYLYEALTSRILEP